MIKRSTKLRKVRAVEEARDVAPRADGALVTVPKPRCWESFFKCQPSPVFRSQLLAGLMAGVKIEVARIPTSTLLDAVLLATAARTCCDAEIVDDYQSLLDRARDAWRAPDWTCHVFSSTHAAKADFILTQGMTDFVCAEDAYIPEMVSWYLRQDAPDYFDHELETDKDVRTWRRAA
jgi:hypothetical protein